MPDDLVGPAVRVCVPSVRYADFLAVTLPAWRAMFETASLAVVTSPEDEETQAVARRCGVDLVVTNAWHRGGRKFDKAAALDEAFGFAGGRRRPPKEGESLLSIDADVYPFGTLPQGRLRKDTIYGCPRYYCADMSVLNAHIKGETSLESLPLMMQRQRGISSPPEETRPDPDRLKHASKACLGYFQLWRHTGHAFGSFPSAGGYDIAFRRQFRRRQGLEGFYVLHLGIASRKNWRGRVVPTWEATA